MPKGEMNVSEIRNLARQHNKLSTIRDIDKKTRGALIAEIKKMGYSINHMTKKAIRMPSMKGKAVKVGEAGATKDNKTTRKKKARKKLVGSGPAVPLYGGDEV